MLVIRARCLFFVLVVCLALSVCAAFAVSKTDKTLPRAKVYRIIIDAGHGFPDGGAVGVGGSIESDLNLKVALLLEKNLAKKGFDVLMTRRDKAALESGKKSDMQKRLDIMQSSDADIFVSIHMNKFSDARYFGAQVLYSPFLGSDALAKDIQAELCLLEDNKSKRAVAKAPSSLFLMKNASVPSVIVECGFLSNTAEEALLNTARYQTQLAEAICRGIQFYFNSGGKNENIYNR